MRSTIVAAACVLVATLAACSQDNPGPALSINPSGTGGTISVTGPTDFAAVLINSTDDVSWSVSGGGTISSMTGLHVVYVPPAGTAMATLTATTAGGLSASVLVNAGPATLTGETIPGLTAPVTVEYDAEDIPHIKCATSADCIAVQGYVQAHDRLFPMDFLRHVARSRLAEMIGVDGLSQDVQLRTLFTTRAGHRLEDDLVAALDAPTAALLAAYVSGVNAYIAQLRTSGDPLPGEYAQLPYPLTATDIPDWTAADTVAMVRLFQFQLSESLSEETSFGQFAAVYAQGPLKDLAKVNAWIRAAAPTTEQGHTLAPAAPGSAPATAPTRVPATDLSAWQGVLGQARAQFDALRGKLRPNGVAVGSNNWVIAGTKSATHVAMVANDPHLSLQYPPLFHLATLTSTNAADNLDLAGGAFPGLPGAQVGRGAHVGWGVTVVGYDVTDLYLEQFLPSTSCPVSAIPCVLFKSAPTSTLPVPVTFNVRVGPGTAVVNATSLGISVPPVVLIVPQHGPIVQAPDAGGHGVSVRWTGQEGNTQDLKAFLGLNTATDVDSAILALKGYATGAQNFVLADDQGHIAYDPHALVPVRNFADIRVVGANAIPPWFPLPGDGTAEWGDGVANCASATATPVPASCWLDDALLPQGKDPAKGYFFTANADPTSPSVSDDNNPLAHPPYLSFDWDDSSGFRATRINQLLAAAIAANGSVSLDDMKAIQADHVSRPGLAFAPTIAALDGTGNPDLAAAQAVIAQWVTNGADCPSGLLGSDPKISPVDTTPTVVQNSAGCFLFHEFVRILATNVFTDDLAVVGQGVNGLQALKAMLFMLSLDETTPAGLAQTKFCNDVNKTGTVIATHTCHEQVATALVTAYDTLIAQVGPQPTDWVWGRVHTMQPVSQLALVTTNYAPGPFARPGGAFTVDVGSPSLSANGLDFSYGASGNVRHISVMDPAAPIVKMQLPGPERDTPALFVGPDLIGQWVTNTYFDFAYGAQIDAAVVSTQTFTAQ